MSSYQLSTSPELDIYKMGIHDKPSQAHKSNNKRRKIVELVCDGCRNNSCSQNDHMGIGGCLADDYDSE